MPAYWGSHPSFPASIKSILIMKSQGLIHQGLKDRVLVPLLLLRNQGALNSGILVDFKHSASPREMGMVFATGLPRHSIPVMKTSPFAISNSHVKDLDNSHPAVGGSPWFLRVGKIQRCC